MLRTFLVSAAFVISLAALSPPGIFISSPDTAGSRPCSWQASWCRGAASAGYLLDSVRAETMMVALLLLGLAQSRLGSVNLNTLGWLLGNERLVPGDAYLSVPTPPPR